MLSLVRLLLNYPLGDERRVKVERDLISFITYYIFDSPPAETEIDFEEDDESEEDFQERVEQAVRKVRAWDWEAPEDDEEALAVVESVVRSCKSIGKLSKVSKPRALEGKDNTEKVDIPEPLI